MRTQKSDPIFQAVQTKRSRDMAQIDRFFVVLLGLHWLAAMTIMPYAYNTYKPGIVIGGVAFAIALAAYVFGRGKLYCRLTMGALLMMFSGLFIQQTLGRIETHFHVFGGLAILLVYRDWRVILSGVLTIALHHLGFSYLQYQEQTLLGVPIIVFNYGCDLGIVMLHVYWVLFESLILGYFSFSLNKERMQSLHFSEQMHYLANNPDDSQFQFQTSGKSDPEERSLLQAVNKCFEDRTLALNHITDSSQFIAKESRLLFKSSSEMNGLSFDLKEKTDGLDAAIHEVVHKAANTTQATSNANDIIQEVALAAQEISQRSTTVAEQAKQLNGSTKDNAHYFDEFQSGLNKSAQHLSQIVERSKLSTQHAHTADQQMTVLSQCTQGIGKVVDLIKTIAEQTNLLALNATIEAARAGEAGKGFAVVANEIKELATQTTQATKNISDQIQEIQSESDHALKSIQEAGLHIHELNDLVADLGQTSQTQANMVTRITDNIATSVKASDHLTENIHHITEGVTRVTTNFHEVARNSNDISKAVGEISEVTLQMKDGIQSSNQLTEKVVEMSSKVNEAADQMQDLSNNLDTIIGNINAGSPDQETLAQPNAPLKTNTLIQLHSKAV